MEVKETINHTVISLGQKGFLELDHFIIIFHLLVSVVDTLQIPLIIEYCPFLIKLMRTLSFPGKYSWDELHLSGIKKYQQYGPIVKERLYPGVDLLFLFDPDDIATLLNDKNSKDYPQRKSHLALAKYRNERPHIYRSAGLLPT